MLSATNIPITDAEQRVVYKKNDNQNKWKKFIIKLDIYGQYM